MHGNWVWRQIIGPPKIPININQAHDLLVSLAPNLEPIAKPWCGQSAPKSDYGLRKEGVDTGNKRLQHSVWHGFFAHSIHLWYICLHVLWKVTKSSLRLNILCMDCMSNNLQQPHWTSLPMVRDDKSIWHTVTVTFIELDKWFSYTRWFDTNLFHMFCWATCHRNHVNILCTLRGIGMFYHILRCVRTSKCKSHW